MKKRHLFIAAVAIAAISRLFAEPEKVTAPDAVPLEETLSASSDGTNNSALHQLNPSNVATPTVRQRSNDIKGAALTIKNVRKFVSGSRVAFREGPSTDRPIIDRFDKGNEVQLLETDGDWSKVRDALTQRVGWLATRFLVTQKPAADVTPDKEPVHEAESVAKPDVGMPESVIVQKIIEESIASYPGSCACPYNVDRGGRRCGKRSAYAKPGGYAPLCFAGDVSKAMIAAFIGR